MSTPPEATDATLTTAIVGNAEIVEVFSRLYGETVIKIRDDNGVLLFLDSRAVNTSYKVGQRGWLEYRDYEFGSRWFFDAATKGS